MRTTINDLVDRRGGAYVDQGTNDVLSRARKILADATVLLELEIDRLFALESDPDDTKRLQSISDLIRQTQRAMTMVLQFEATTDAAPQGDDATLDLGAAHDEIMRRLDRIADTG